MTQQRRDDESGGAPASERGGIEPYPDRDERPEAPSGPRGSLVALAIVGAVLLIVVVVHLIGGGFSPHGP